ncbi:tol-pal system protein YbgF [Mesorhizobium sp. M1C.F.Ca.ET.193.01.1.1]|uniref:tol-pal system protein YbgF n=1 Tax=unclassified Mesorhizobium TaxID=325217 RepID=UPI000FD35268|nr:MULTISPECIES: tol-pal system protein YbgF [unclassified Mesorhizobium]TGT04590.1 tol-pal system protein YbgF [bacterium M00.F.Ca.ET.177.01.1.1]TGQ57419.1 tol-pal system protein YbgF [Mesorhizobium sp. M1C.F.Ca.ET.210.01.1.1]TGQ75876.1 tol-pal system protein YbgF [Mesorhizobium sp. M1C.F.Ca.ET.212.01.1.1]TGR14259.1 tol-pal system protein YbgF [Mesorhizobium sp. M1C.F.Ca.ET.204.01.1.1]TGR35421.1 tol-pal system protein YbgF [Mesorhizobium sp. M1C.F.Ca.ET.196.01.1.1]
MHFRTVLSGTLALLLVSSIAGVAAPADSGQASDSGFTFHLPTLGIFGDKKKPEQAQMAQQDSAGMTGVEDQLRQMNGKIEELNFQILQMQEQMRKQQEDNEFRFQQLEGGSQGAKPTGQKKSEAAPQDGNTGNGNTNVGDSGSGDSGTGTSVAAAPATQPPAATGGQDGGGKSVGDVIVESQTGDPGKLITGAPPKTFGTITVDKNGNVVNAESDPQAGSQAPAATANAPSAETASKSGKKSGGTVMASLPSTNDPDELYRNSYQFILSGDYPTAEQGFRDHISRFPKDAKAPDAHYWLGESLLGQQKYRDAAEVFLAASKEYPKAKKAPDMLLKLGVSLVGLKQNDVACATFNEIGKRYPDVSGTLKERIKQEKALASC